MGNRLKRLPLLALVAVVALALVSGLARAANAPTAPKPLRVLFIGNSQTSTNDLPAFVAAIAKAYKQTIKYRTIAPSAVTLQGNWNTGSARGALLGGGWDAVVLQQGPSGPPREPREPLLLREGLRRRGARVGARPFLLMVWPRRGSGVAEVIDAYSAAAAGAETGLLPGGVAWAAAQRRGLDLPLYRWDGIHPGTGAGGVPRRAGRLAGLRSVAAVAPNSLVVNGNPFWIPRDTARLLRDSAREALSTRFSTPACSQL